VFLVLRIAKGLKEILIAKRATGILGRTATFACGADWILNPRLLRQYLLDNDIVPSVDT
jgi:hypothetical protein